MQIRQIYKFFAAMFLIISIFIVLSGGVGVTYAAQNEYSSVLADLRKDSNFNTNYYPSNSKDYSIKLIQIAESSGKELFVYTYQPCQKTTPLTAVQINIALTDKLGGEVTDETQLYEKDKPKLYDLELINSDGVFCKYKVNGFTVGSEAVRYYNITSIFRKWIKDVDSETGNDNEKNFVYSKVGKLYRAETVDGKVSYTDVIRDVVEIINPYVDFMSYYEGMTWASAFGLAPEKYTDVHYIAFSTDKKIDTLKEADVTYRTQDYKVEAFNKGTVYGDESDPQYITLTGEMTGSAGGGFLSDKYTWKCIQTTDDFIKSTGIDSGNIAYDNLKDTEFVLVFHTTPFEFKEVYSVFQGHSREISGTKVSRASILRLMFQTGEKTYNLGVLMDQQTGDDIPGNGVKPLTFFAYIWRCIVRLFKGTATLTEQIVAVVTLFIVVLALPILLTVLSLCFPAFGAVVKTILKGLWWIISAPIQFLKWVFNKLKGGD